MFLNHLIARAEGTAPVLKSAPKLAQELEDPAWSPAPDTDLPEVDAVAPLPSALPRSRPARSSQPPRAVEPAPDSKPGPTRPPTSAASATTPQSLQAPASTKPALARSMTSTAETPQLRPATPLPLHREQQPENVSRRTTPAESSQAPTPLPPSPPSTPPAPQISPEIIAALAPPPATAAQPEPGVAQPDPVAAEPEPAERIEVHVEIGQLDLVSPPPPTRPAPNPASRTARPGPDLSLTDYLERGRGNRR